MYDFWNASDKGVKDKTSQTDATGISNALAAFTYGAEQANAQMLGSDSAFQQRDGANENTSSSKSGGEDLQAMKAMDESRQNDTASSSLPELTLYDSSQQGSSSNSGSEQQELPRAA